MRKMIGIVVGKIKYLVGMVTKILVISLVMLISLEGCVQVNVEVSLCR
uniref:Uncharacterized protein n=1 Tax=Arundo donax TaxID=35708 RepID=A0A0A9FNJ9_ARUDO